jgi:5-methylcytosine-specific restriction endonuclease McrA
VKKPRRSWCSDACVLEFTQRYHQGAFRSAVWNWSDKRCAVCRIDLDALGKLLESLEYGQRGAVRAALGYLGHGYADDLWQADHIVPKLFDGGELDPKRNGRILCRRCHSEKTKLDIQAKKDFEQEEA